MDNEKRNEEIKEAQQWIVDNDFKLISDRPETTLAVIRIINAIQKEGYQLIKFKKLLNGINILGKKAVSRGGNSGESYIEALEDIADLIKDCL